MGVWSSKVQTSNNTNINAQFSHGVFKGCCGRCRVVQESKSSELTDHVFYLILNETVEKSSTRQEDQRSL
jgi:hypothetical protein